MIDPNEVMPRDISPDFRGATDDDRYVARGIVEREATPEAIRFFAKTSHRLSDYAYWFFLGTLWVSYTGYSDLALWKKLFRSRRPHRQTSLMKPSELRRFSALPTHFEAFRVHRDDETDWIAYTLSRGTATEFAARRQAHEVHVYRLRKTDVVALFTRRGEAEVLMLEPERAELVQVIPVVRDAISTLETL